ncbi:FAD-binding oxidoreductase [Paracraurococcus lichenis]|uniref:FAD-binding oxidoreductase n=1 Tax=Paracraurococcus lichenis TaxID=3064888 RepID=A0ABT9DST6_9PROT|nr:FAD-binding oxidoreductase [Paracraurococcus sp. LOR1-02]MDO9706961.1 FAD-binding oxidoreductase [Paracraurococcus sp. LOR1-02]
MPDTMTEHRALAVAPRTAAWKDTSLQGWGRSVTAPCLAARPERMRDLAAALEVPEGRTLLPHGGGRSYGDQALNSGGAALLTTRLDRILSFDPETGVVITEPGVTFADLLEAFLPRGWLAPTSPGTAFATIGGAVANDVHGKNHHRAGSFGDHVLWLDLLLPDGRTLRISDEEEPALFRATIGGMGLTGIVTTVCFRLQPVPSNALQVRSRRVRDLDSFLAGFAESAEATWSVGWIDALASGRALGRGILETAEPAERGVPAPPAKSRTFPLEAPGWLLNRATVKAFNALYWRRVPAGGRVQTQHYGKFLYPLDAILHWNRMYGRRGFHQFQCVLPFGPGEAALRQLLETIAASGNASFLAVLKVMGRPGRGLLSFALPGYSLALDIPSRPGVRELYAALERITRDAGGRIYLAKDSLLSAEGFWQMYPEAQRFMEIRASVDPQGRLSSDMAKRLALA